MDPKVLDLIAPALGDPVAACRVFDSSGRAVWDRPVNKRVSSWSSVYDALLALVPDSVVRRGARVVEAGQDGDGAWLRLADDARHRFDLLIGADGIGSVIRPLVDPGFQSDYLGYVAFRGMLPLAAVPDEARLILESGDHAPMVNGYLDRSHLVSYLIPSAGGERVVNWMWYRNVPATDLPRHLTDRDGTVHEWSVPPGSVGRDLEAAVFKEADSKMAPWMAGLIQTTDQLSIQAIFAGNAKRFHSGRMALVGDAARIAIPHIGAGTSMAIGDAYELATILDGARAEELEPRLETWDRNRRAATLPAVEFARELGHCLQFSGADWNAWGEERFKAWWCDLIAGRRLYFESFGA